MNNPEVWETSKPHGECVSALLEEFKDKFHWHADGTDSLMDIGCAGGSVTMEYIRPIMPSNFERLIGVDISKKMIDYAQKTYSQPRIQFKTFDIVTGDTDELPQVDHVISIYVFHFLHDQAKALTNIFNLLKPGGDCLIVSISLFLFYTAYEQIARYPKWYKFIKNVDDVIPPSYYSKNPEADFERLLKKCHFSNVEINTRENILSHDDINRFKNIVKSIVAFYTDIPLSEHDSFTSDYAQLAVDIFNSAVNAKPSNDSKVYLPVRNLVAYAKKYTFFENTIDFSLSNI